MITEPTQGVHLQLQAFQGPLDLLLHLIEREELDIHDIPIARITDQYMIFLENSVAFQMEVASEFLVMAATLIAMKARSLLPRPQLIEENIEADEFFEEVSKQELTRKLLLYRAYRSMTAQFEAMEAERSLVMGRMPMPIVREHPPGISYLQGLTLQDLQYAFERAWARTQQDSDVEVMRDYETIPQRMRAIERLLQGGPVNFEQLLNCRNRHEIVTVFLALLELLLKQRVRCIQEVKFGDIWIEMTEQI